MSTKSSNNGTSKSKEDSNFYLLLSLISYESPVDDSDYYESNNEKEEKGISKSKEEDSNFYLSSLSLIGYESPVNKSDHYESNDEKKKTKINILPFPLLLLGSRPMTIWIMKATMTMPPPSPETSEVRNLAATAAPATMRPLQGRFYCLQLHWLRT